MAVDTLRFERARGAVPRPGGQGIGTLGEKTLHAVLKEYYRTPEAQKEVPLGAFVADLWDGDGATEIQTGNLSRLDAKLAAWLPRHPVHVVYPLAHTKWVLWLDDETGAVSPKRRSPKKGQAAHALAELYAIRPHLKHTNLRLTVALVDVLEYRLFNSRTPGGKRGSTRFDRVPLALAGEVCIHSPVDWPLLVPPALPRRFTAKDFRAAAGLRAGRGAWSALKVLEHMEAVRRADKQGNAIIYQWAGAPAHMEV